ncbi:39S ribosomal protein L18, mitochondrial [Tupaia chinensis]|uniref:Large ribosomal subunit protein uL18m n=1 Tax=Tupaia chinensis TaxID=246437 RepID=L9KJX7_TUPCH|nr:39S ribosomal protein L18, mitochondrial [Tupaia chinensis]
MALRSRFWELLVCRNPERGFAALSSTSKPAVKPEVDPLENEAVASEFTNRNPRNLELLGVARKERGWATVWPSREFWHRLRVTRTQHHIEAFVEHCNGQVVVSASTREWAIKKHLYSTRNVVACESVGRVLAERCLEAGIHFMVYQPTPWEAASDSLDLEDECCEELKWRWKQTAAACAQQAVTWMLRQEVRLEMHLSASPSVLWQVGATAVL